MGYDIAKGFNLMIIFGEIILVSGLFLSHVSSGLTEMCDSVKVDGFEEPNQCTPRSIPLNFFGMYLLPGIILIGSCILLKKKNG